MTTILTLKKNQLGDTGLNTSYNAIRIPEELSLRTPEGASIARGRGGGGDENGNSLMFKFCC